jgi:hypothetical protein
MRPSLHELWLRPAPLPQICNRMPFYLRTSLINPIKLLSESRKNTIHKS